MPWKKSARPLRATKPVPRCSTCALCRWSSLPPATTHTVSPTVSSGAWRIHRGSRSQGSTLPSELRCNTVLAPISSYVLKVHSRCDLACDHCYVYEHADQSWQRKPRAISPRTVAAAASRIAEHAEHAGTHGLKEISVVL